MIMRKNDKLFFLFIIIFTFYSNTTLGEEQSHVSEWLKQTTILSGWPNYNNNNETQDRNTDFHQLAMLGAEK